MNIVSFLIFSKTFDMHDFKFKERWRDGFELNEMIQNQCIERGNIKF